MLHTFEKKKYNLYILIKFRKLVIISKNVKNTSNLIRSFLFLKNKNMVKIVIQQNYNIKKTTRKTFFFLKINTLSI